MTRDLVRRGVEASEMYHFEPDGQKPGPDPKRTDYNSLAFDGLDAFLTLLERGFGPDGDGDWRLLPTSANRMPAVASYLRRPGDSDFRPFKLDVLRVEGGAISEITTFGSRLFPQLGLPVTL